MDKKDMAKAMRDAQAAHKAEDAAASLPFRVLTGPDGHRWRVCPSALPGTQVAQVFSDVANDWVDTDHDPAFLRFLLDLFDNPFE